MAKYNSVGTKTGRMSAALPVNTPDVKNLAGGDAFSETAEVELISLLLTNFMRPQYYRGENDTEARLKSVIASLEDKRYAAQAAIFARKQFGMRSVSHVVAGEIAGQVKGAEWTKDFFYKVINRPDDMFEILSYFKKNYGDKEPNALKKGFARKLSELDEYLISKYKGSGRSINMFDLIHLCHPKSTPAITALWNGTLKPADTWETAISGVEGETDEQKAEAKSVEWTRLLNENKLGYFALLRNLRNILTYAPEAVPVACAQLVNPKAIKDSLVLPFRFTTAYNELKHVAGAQPILRAIGDAVNLSVSNIPDFEGNTVVFFDNSGSMTTSVGSSTAMEIGALFSAALGAGGADIVVFNDTATMVNVGGRDVLGDMETLLKQKSGGTNFHAPFELITKLGKKYDRIIILSDMQAWVQVYLQTSNPTQTSLVEYKSKIGAEPKLYSWDLAGYGSLQFPQKDVYLLAGFSEKIFDFMTLMENGAQEALVDAVKSIEL